MTKNEELETLRKTAEKLGRDSYCGPWLLDQIPCIESEIRSDFLPTPSFSESRRMHENTLAEAKKHSAEIIKTAEEKAEKILREAQDKADLIRHRIKWDLQKALDTL